MPKFEVFEGNPRLNLETAIIKNVYETGYGCTVLESNDEKIRISVTTSDFRGTGEEEHNHVLGYLKEKIEYIDDGNSKVTKHPTAGSYNIVIECDNLFNSKHQDE
ncbi:hypothetical protein KC723_01080 [Candidatus Kaiserbacteria bacterium]|nr:hypothetical protein [Candidatus Kaiserbacteria bacterium]